MNVRWDDVVDRAAVDFRNVPPPQLGFVTNQGGGCIDVNVRLFGALASVTAERFIQLKLPTTTTIADMLAILGAHFGKEFLAHILDEAGAMRRYCRLFVGGYLVEHLQTTLHATADPSEIDIILLIAPEGG